MKSKLSLPSECILKEKSNLPGSIFPGCTTAGLVLFASAAVCTVFMCIQQFNANCLSHSIQIDFIPLHFSLWILFTRKNKSGWLLFSLSIFKQSTASYVCLLPQIYMVCVAWCGIGRQESIVRAGNIITEKVLTNSTPSCTIPLQLLVVYMEKKISSIISFHRSHR